jgi:peptidoglycan hydrolase-like protein with peptidoglycan-binding domain
MNKKLMWIIVASTVLVGSGIALYVFSNKDKKGNGKNGGEADTSDTDVLSSPDETEYSLSNKIAGDDVLQVGSKGRKVAMLQAILNHFYNAGLGIDGAFGDGTKNAVRIHLKYMTCFGTSKCTIDSKDTKALFNKAAKTKSFTSKYNVNRNADIKRVWDKYSS